MYRSWCVRRSDLPESQALADLHDFFCAGRCDRKLMCCRPGYNLLVKVDKPIEGDVSGIDIQVIGLGGRVLGNHRLCLAVGR